MPWWTTYWQQFVSFVERLDAWRSWLPEQTTPAQAALITVGVFLGVTLLLMVVSRLLIGVGRNQPEALGSRRPLILGRLTEAFAWVLPVTRRKREMLRRELVQAGYYHRKALEEFLAFRNAGLMLWLLFIGAAVVLLASPDENQTPRILTGGAIVTLLLFTVPRVVLSMQAESRRKRVQYALPDALDMINMTVTGGLPLRQALQRVGRELKSTHPDIACELAIVNCQADTGSLDQALRQFAQRIDTPDVTVLATMVRHAEQLGGNVTTAFRDFSDSIRRTRRQLAEERGNKASIKLLFPIVFCLAPPIYILLLGPAALELKDFMQRERRPGGALSQSIDEDLSRIDSPVVP